MCILCLWPYVQRDWLPTISFQSQGTTPPVVEIAGGADGGFDNSWMPMCEPPATRWSLPAMVRCAQHTAAVSDWWRALPSRHLRHAGWLAPNPITL